MPRKKDLAMERYTRQMRIRSLEAKAAVEYPDAREKLLTECEQLRAELTDLEPQIKQAKRAATKRLRDAATDYAVARSEFVRLQLGALAHDPGLVIHDVNRATATAPIRDALLAVLDVEAAPEPVREVPEHQHIHEERIRNERAGNGYRTDDEVRRGVVPHQNAGAGAEFVPGFDLSGVSGGGN